MSNLCVIYRKTCHIGARDFTAAQLDAIILQNQMSLNLYANSFSELCAIWYPKTAILNHAQLNKRNNELLESHHRVR